LRVAIDNATRLLDGSDARAAVERLVTALPKSYEPTR